MKLLDDIIESITEAKEPVSDTLRRCLVLAYKLKNDTLKRWIEKELNGYDHDEELPSYRQSAGIARGVFLGGFGAQLNDQPLPPFVMKETHRHWADTVKLTQPIAAYEGKKDDSNAMLPWPADLVAMYQKKFIEDMALNRAWIEIPGSMIKGLVDTVRTRVLTLVLQIQEELGDSDQELDQALPPAKVEQMVHVTIFGGNNIIGDVGQFNPQTIIVGDINSLKEALTGMGVTAAEMKELEAHLKSDAKGAGKEEGAINKTDGWAKKTAKRVGEAGLKVGSAVAEEMLKQALKRYLGLS